MKYERLEAEVVMFGDLSFMASSITSEIQKSNVDANNGTYMDCGLPQPYATGTCSLVTYSYGSYVCNIFYVKFNGGHIGPIYDSPLTCGSIDF